MGGIDPTLSGVIYTAGGGMVLAVALAAAKTFGKHRQDARDAQGLREFFFDTPGNPRSGVPARKGWTTLVDERQTRMERKLDQVLHQVEENGGNNMRAEVQRAAKKAEES